MVSTESRSYTTLAMCEEEKNAAELRCIDGDVVYEKGNTWVHL